MPPSTTATADSARIKDLIYSYFQLGKSKDLEKISGFLDAKFTKFGDSPPYDRRDLDRALMLEQLHFASVSDYDFAIEDMRVDMLGDSCAVATFLLQSTGMVVDDYSFRGAAVKNKSRVTIVLLKEKGGQTGAGEGGEWKMVHQHLSAFSG